MALALFDLDNTLLAGDPDPVLCARAEAGGWPILGLRDAV